MLIGDETIEIEENDLILNPDSRKQVIAFWDRVTTIHKESSTPTKMRKTNSRQIQYNVENFHKIIEYWREKLVQPITRPGAPD